MMSGNRGAISEQDDREIARKVCEGDDNAFEDLAIRHQARLRGFIARFIADREDVFDVAQNVFIEAYRSIEKFDATRSFEYWLFGIARNMTKRHLRREARRRRRETKLFEETLDDWRDQGLEQRSEEDERLRLLRECLQKLDRKSRMLIEKHHMEGVALGALAHSIGKTIGAAAMQMMRIRAALAKCVRARQGKDCERETTLA